MIKQFLGKMGVDCKGEEWKTMKKEWKMNNPWKFSNGENRCGKGQHKLQRAVIVSKPEDVIECVPGSVVIADLKIKNNTHWNWKKGIFLGMDESIDIVGMPIEVVHMPIDMIDVKAMETFDLSVPIQIAENAIVSDKVFEVLLRFRGPKGGEFG